MKLNVPTSLKSRLTDDDSRIMVTVVIATIVTVFCLVSSKALMAQSSYQSRVLKARNIALKRLEDNKKAFSTLSNQYNTVLEGNDPANVIGGKNTTADTAIPPDGDNARVILDGLPAGYDFPALVSSITKILYDDNINTPSLSASDQSSTIVDTPSFTPTPQAIPVVLSGTTTYDGVQKLIRDLERSIRPFDVYQVSLSGTVNTMTFSISANTYYQPIKTFKVSEKVVH